MSNPNSISYFNGDSQNKLSDYASNSTGYDIIVARVKFVLLDDSNKEKFAKLGGWKALGSIECVPFMNFNDPSTDVIIARPLDSNVTRYPLENELVIIRTLPSKKAQNNLGNYEPEKYYDNTIPVFNEPEENASPDKSFYKLNPNAKSVTGNYVSKNNKRLLKAPGDITIEGRRGSSIRLGSNSSNFSTPWKAANLNPIVIISNNPLKGNIPSSIEVRFEDINNDGSTLVMMSGHNINFQPASNNFKSYDTTVVDKNNVVVVDQNPKTQPDQSLKQQDDKTAAVDNLATKPIPVSNATPPDTNDEDEIDEEDLPDREDLISVEIDTEEYLAPSAGRSGLVDLFGLTTYLPDASTNSSTSTVKSTLKPSAKRASKLTPSFITLASDFKVNPNDLIRILEIESGGNFEASAVYKKIDKNAPGKRYILNPRAGYKLVAAGVISFTEIALKCIGLTSLQQILGTSYEYQVGLLRNYMNCWRSKFYGADKYALYATVFYPILAKNGRIVKPDDFIIGSEKSMKWAQEVAVSNPIISKGNSVITVAAFKRFVDSIF